MKTIKEINEKIKKGQVVVITAKEAVQLVRKKGAKKASQEVDVVTTGTFGPMCSSAAYFNIGHCKPRIKIGGGSCDLNEVPCYTGFAAVDILLGATALPEDDPRNKVFPGEFKYGGAHVIHELVAGKDVKLEAYAYGTDCYPRKEIKTFINLKDINEAVLFNIRNCYQNYNVAVNLSDKTIYTYMGMLKPKIGNANYCSAGELSPLLKDPNYRTIGIGTKIFLGGGVGYVSWQGTQHNPIAKRLPNGITCVPAGTLAVIGDLKKMRPKWLVGVSMLGYGVSLAVGIGVPIPVLDEQVMASAGVPDDEIFASIVDYSKNYPNMIAESLGQISYADLESGKINIRGKDVLTGNLSSRLRALQIAEELKSWIKKGDFALSESVAPLPDKDSGYTCRALKEKPFK
ncbi:MAG: homocysteine biosynthesis protein [Candidatus Omnitrophica bacterium]|jgi:uncharacterized protein (DUF39 family)|nr:homocysteine biosynthesis protein [Candidatus Omnitrophota bacterium]